MADFLRLIDGNAGVLRLKEGEGILHLKKRHGKSQALILLSFALLFLQEFLVFLTLFPCFPMDFRDSARITNPCVSL